MIMMMYVFYNSIPIEHISGYNSLIIKKYYYSHTSIPGTSVLELAGKYNINTIMSLIFVYFASLPNL